MTKHHSTVLSKNIEALNILRIVLKVEQPIYFQPGQYVTLMISGYFPRNYSIASLQTPSDQIEILVNTKVKGVGSSTLKDIQIGDKIDLIGPTGNFLLKMQPKESWFIATGTGIAPLIPMINSVKNQSENVLLFYGNSYVENLPNLSFLQIPVIYSLTKPSANWNGEKGRIYEIVIKKLKLNLQLINTRNYYICGSPGMVNNTNKRLLGIGIEKENIIFERFSL